METPIIKTGIALVASVSNQEAIREALNNVDLTKLDFNTLKLISAYSEGVTGLKELATAQVKAITAAVQSR